MKDLIKIISSIAAAMPHGHPYRINSVFAIRSPETADMANFEQSIRAGAIGEYWGRRYYASGKDENMMCAEYPAIGINETSYIGNGCSRIQIAVFAPPSCEGCELSGMTPIEIKTMLSRALEWMVDELLTVSGYTVNINGDNGPHFLSDGQVHCLMQSGVDFPTLNCINSAGSMRVTWPDKVIYPKVYGANLLYTSDTNIVVCQCVPSAIIPLCSAQDVERVGYAKCSVC